MKNFFSTAIFVFELGPTICTISFRRKKEERKYITAITYGNLLLKGFTYRQPTLRAANKILRKNYDRLMVESNQIIRSRQEAKSRHFVTLGKP